MFPDVRVSGDATSRGRQYGEHAADRVARSIAAYRELFAYYAAMKWPEVTELARQFVEPIERFGASYLDEMRGVAEGADVSLDDVVALNIRTEVMFAGKARHAAATLPRVAECTAFAAVPADDGRVLVGQNWDWMPHAFDTVVVLEAERDDGPNYVTVVEAGLLAKTGLNAHGLGVVTNALVTDADQGVPGVPYHVLLRALLDARTPSEALATLQRGRRSSSANYLFGHRDRLALNVEAAPGDFTQLTLALPDERGVLLHTNHFLDLPPGRSDVGVWVMPDSPFRLQRAQSVLRRHDPFDSATWEGLFADHAGHPAGLCCHPDPELPRLEQGATVSSVVMDLDARTLRLADGNPCLTGFRTVDYSGFLAA